MKKIYTGGFTVFLACLFATALPSQAGIFTDLHDFANGSTTNGALPNGVILYNGQLYGTTAQGGGYSNGMVFTLGTNGTGFASIHDFQGMPTDGSSPNELLQAGNMFYGTTSVGGTNEDNLGTIFAMNTSGSGYTILRSFTNSPDPQYPLAGLILGGATLYGTSQSGGSNGFGSVFKIDTNGANFAVLYSFTNSPDGASPQGRLVLNGATLYGTTAGGGSNNFGTVFALNTNGTGYSVIYDFSNTPAARVPDVGLSFSGNTLYGVSASGGISNAGAVFQLGTNGAGFEIIHSFTNNEGLSPQGALVVNNGLLYGTTLSRGTGLGGIIFQVATNGANFTVLKNFTNAINGANPKGQLVLDGNLIFGIANASGPGGAGTVYQLLNAPLINSQPQSVIVTNGNPASFTVAAADENALTYQWYLNTSTLLGGQTSATLNFASATNGNAGTYTVVISDNANSVTSSPAVLTVYGPPTITAQPQSILVTNGNPASFTVTATTLSGTLAYQWYFNTNTLIAGQTNNAYTIPLTLTNNAGAYTVVVANNIGSVTSSPAILTVSLNSGPIISGQPQNLVVTNGTNATFSVTASGLSTLRYQWYSNSVNTAIGILLASKTNTFLTLSNVGTSYNTRYFSVVITNMLGKATSSPPALLTVISAPVIVSNPQPATVYVGNPATFMVTALGANLRYQWYSNSVNTAIGTLLAGMTNNLYSFTGITNSNGRYYSVVVTNTFGKATSSPPALLTVSSLPYITLQPVSTIISNTSSITFTSTAAGPGPLSYQWLYQTNLLVAGATNTILTLSNISPQGVYSMKVTNSFGSVTSSLAVFTIATLPVPTITLQPLDETITDSSSITFTSAAAGPGPLYYQWLYQTNLPVAGATNTTLSLFYTNQPGYYSMAVANSFGAATSSPALLTISVPLPYITLQPLSATITNGSSITFTSAAAGGSPLGYQWLYHTNLLIAGATSTALTFPTANQPGAYSMEVTNVYGAATSSPAILTVVGRPIMLASVFYPASGSYGFTFANLAGSTNRLWATTNLTSAAAWQAIATNFMVTNGIWQFTDTNTARTNAMRFYRFSSP